MSPLPIRSDDLALVQGARSKQEPGLSRFLERMRCIPRFVGQRNARSGSPLAQADLDDLCQDIYMKVWTRLDSYRGEASLETWVYSFCAIKYMERRRKGSRRTAPLEAAVHLPDEGLPAPAARLDDDHLYGALRALPEAEARVVHLKHFEDLSFDALGKRLRLSTNTAKTRYYRGLQRLQARLGPLLGPQEETA